MFQFDGLICMYAWKLKKWNDIHGNTFHCDHSLINATCYFELKILSLQVQDSYIRLSNNRDLYEIVV
jgi:hypothetical protein